ncbi:hypothetical protein Hanom_Chr07g00646421 [Helianthus anomalus]
MVLRGGTHQGDIRMEIAIVFRSLFSTPKFFCNFVDLINGSRSQLFWFLSKPFSWFKALLFVFINPFGFFGFWGNMGWIGDKRWKGYYGNKICMTLLYKSRGRCSITDVYHGGVSFEITGKEYGYFWDYKNGIRFAGVVFMRRESRSIDGLWCDQDIEKRLFGGTSNGSIMNYRLIKVAKGREVFFKNNLQTMGYVIECCSLYWWMCLTEIINNCMFQMSMSDDERLFEWCWIVGVWRSYRQRMVIAGNIERWRQGYFRDSVMMKIRMFRWLKIWLDNVMVQIKIVLRSMSLNFESLNIHVWEGYYGNTRILDTVWQLKEFGCKWCWWMYRSTVVFAYWISQFKVMVDAFEKKGVPVVTTEIYTGWNSDIMNRWIKLGLYIYEARFGNFLKKCDADVPSWFLLRMVNAEIICKTISTTAEDKCHYYSAGVLKWVTTGSVLDRFSFMEIGCWFCYMRWLICMGTTDDLYYIGTGWLCKKWSSNDLKKNSQVGLKWFWDGLKGIKVAACIVTGYWAGWMYSWASRCQWLEWARFNWFYSKWNEWAQRDSRWRDGSCVNMRRCCNKLEIIRRKWMEAGLDREKCEVGWKIWAFWISFFGLCILLPIIFCIRVWIFVMGLSWPLGFRIGLVVFFV